MKKQLLTALLFLATVFGFLTASKAQSVELHAIVTLNNGQEQTFYLTEDDQFAFEGQETLVISAQGSIERISIDDIRKIEFTDVTGTEESPAKSPLFFPNPVKSTIVLGDIDNGKIIRIYSIEGRLLRQFEAPANKQLDLSDLPSGLYIMNLGEKNYKLLKL